jgi:hypothetical protein
MRPIKLDAWTIGSGAVVVVVLAITVLSFTMHPDATAGAEHGHEPATLEDVPGSDAKRVVLTDKAVQRLGIRTAPVRAAAVAGAPRKLVPYSAILYDTSGGTWTYVAAEPEGYVRQQVDVERVDRGDAVLRTGPPVGAAVVSVGAPELYGTEFGVGH